MPAHHPLRVAGDYSISCLQMTFYTFFIIRQETDRGGLGTGNFKAVDMTLQRL